MSVFSENLRYLRKQKKISQVTLAKELEISPSAITMYEQGKREPSFELLKKMSDFFQVDFNFLLGEQIASGEAVVKNVDFMSNQDKDNLVVRSPQTDYLVSEDLSNNEKEYLVKKSEKEVVNFLQSNPVFNELMRLFEKIDKKDIEKFISLTQEVINK